MNLSIPPVTIGTVLAIIVLVVALVLALMGRIPWELAALVMGLSVARLT